MLTLVKCSKSDVAFFYMNESDLAFITQETGTTFDILTSEHLCNDVFARKYFTNIVANINIVHVNFVRCDVLGGSPHRKLNGVGSSVHHQTKPQRLYAYTPSINCESC